MPTAGQLAVIRRWVGSKVGRDGDLIDGTDLDARLARLSGPEAVALEILGQARADIVLGNPTSFSIAGDQSEDWSKNLEALDKHIATLERICGSPTVAVTRLRRSRPGR